MSTIKSMKREKDEKIPCGNENESREGSVDTAAAERRAQIGKEVIARFEKHLVKKLVEPFANFSAAEKKEKIEEIMLAIIRDCNEILTYEFTHFSSILPGATGADAKISLILFNKKNDCKIIEIWNGSLKMVKEVNKNVKTVEIDSRNVHAAYLVAEVDVHVENSRRKGAKDSEEKLAKLYGVKSLKQGMDDDKFIFSCGNTGIYLITSDHRCLKNLPVNLENVEKWMKSQPRFEDLAHRTKNLSKGDCPFIAYEMKDLHGDEDWDEMTEYYKQREEYWKANSGRLCYYIFCEGDMLLSDLFTGNYGKCPLMQKDYTEIEEYVTLLNETFKNLKFTNKCVKETEDAAIGVELNDEYIVPEEITEPRSQYQPQKWIDGRVPESCLPFSIKQKPVPYRTGKNGNCTWVIHESNWKAKVEERRIMNLPQLPDDCKPFAIMLNTFILEDEFAVYAGNDSKRRRLLKFFTDKADEIVEKNIFYYAVSYLDILFRSGDITAEDFAKHFDNIMQKVVKKKEQGQQDASQPCCSY